MSIISGLNVLFKPVKEMTMTEVDEKKHELFLQEMFLKFAREKEWRLYETNCAGKHGYIDLKNHKSYEIRTSKKANPLMKICFFLGWCPSESFVNIFIKYKADVKPNELEIRERINKSDMSNYRTIYYDEDLF